MAEHSKIEWCDATFNPWLGCSKVSPGCQACYAEALIDKRFGKASWGPAGTRVLTSDANWRQPEMWNRRAPEMWNRRAADGGARPRVFCGSLCDVFEDRRDLVGPRLRLFGLIDRTPHLDWLLLTKRPENIRRMWPGAYQEGGTTVQETFGLRRYNVWLGTSIEDQRRADERLPRLLRCADFAPLLFVSAEPLLGPVQIGIGDCLFDHGVGGGGRTAGISWVICGAESGPNSRPMDDAWARDLRDQCQTAGVAFFMKQRCDARGRKIPFADFPEDLQVREFPKCQTSSVKSQTSLK